MFPHMSSREPAFPLPAPGGSRPALNGGLVTQALRPSLRAVSLQVSSLSKGQDACRWMAGHLTVG